MIPVLFLLLSLSFCAVDAHSEATGEMHGTVVSSHNGLPLPGASIVVDPLDSLAETDEQGRFRFHGLPVGKYTLYVRAKGYAVKIVPGIAINTGMGQEVLVELNLHSAGSNNVDLMELQEVKVRAKKKSILLSRGHEATGTYRLTREEIISMPGTQLDVSRAMQFLPGLNRNNDITTDLIVRGGAPDEVAYLIDGVPIFSVNHFEFGGDKNGYIGNLNMYFLERIDFHNGAFAARYPDKLSGIMDIHFKRGNPDRLSGMVIADLIGTGGYIEGPIPASGGKSTYGFTWRYSSLDLISKAGLIDFEGIPSYQNGHLKISHQAGPGTLHLNLLGATDEFDGDEGDYEYRGRPYFPNRKVTVKDFAVSDNFFGSAKWQQSLGAGEWEVFAGINRRMEEGNRIRRYGSLSDAPSLPEEIARESQGNELNRISWGTEYNLRLGSNWTLVNGLYHEFNTVESHKTFDSTEASAAASPEALWDVNDAFYQMAFYTEILYQNSAWDLYGGARGLYDEFSGDYLIGPRLGVKRHFGSNWLLKYGFGMHTQSQALSSFHLADPSNRLPVSVHNVAGAEASPFNGVFTSLEAFQKETYRIPRFRQDSEDPPLGKTISRGFDLIARQNLGKLLWFNTTFTYTWNREWYQGEWVKTPYSIPRNWTVAFGYNPGNAFSSSLRYSYATGSPYPRSVEDPVSGRLGFEYLLTRRTQSYQRLDLRLDYRKNFRKGSLAAYLEVSNLLDRENWFVTADGEGFNFGWTRFPVGGLTMSF